MGKKIFGSQFSKRETRSLPLRDRIGINFDETLLDCKRCKIKTLHTYNGFKIIFKGQTEFYYECNKCKEVYVSDRKL